jgi:mono/diheme cytochrome c family protein
VDNADKKRYEERYQAAKQRGEKFFPDIIYKDMVVSFALFLMLVLLATFVGVTSEPPADPSDTSYIPRPEWYFLFLFEMLKYFPGELEWVGTTIVPVIAILALLLLPFYDRNPLRHWRKRPVAISIMSVAVVGIVALTIMASVTTPPQEGFNAVSSFTDAIVVGQDLYSLHCVECHGSEGEGGEIVSVEGLEGVVVDPLNAPDFMYTRTDDTIFNVIDYGQQDLGMQPFGKSYGGELQRVEIGAIVTFMRYTWDDRVEIPQEAAAAGAVPTLGPDDIPSYALHVEPIIRRTCVSCHRPNRENNDYLMQTYNEVMNTGINAPNVIPGDLDSNVIRMILRQEIEAGGPMPPTRALKEEWVEIWIRWVEGGALEFPLEPTETPDQTSTP